MTRTICGSPGSRRNARRRRGREVVPCRTFSFTRRTAAFIVSCPYIELHAFNNCCMLDLIRRRPCSAPDRVDRTVGVSGPIESRCQLRFNGEITSCLDRCSIVQTLDDPVLVIPLAKLHQGGSEFGQVAEASNP
jgi:hypothetical protein